MTRSRDTGNVGYRAYKKNFIINGEGTIDQRSISASNGFGPDRWWVNANGVLTQSTSTPIGLPYSIQVVNAGGGTSSLRQSIELTQVGNKAPFKSDIYTLSLWVAVDVGVDIQLVVAYRDGTAAAIGPTIYNDIIHTGTGSWVKVAIPIDMSVAPDVSNQCLSVQFQVTVASTMKITQVQLEEGSVATPFEYRPIGEELALCQRYFWQGTIKNTQSWRQLPAGLGNTVAGDITFPVTLRTTPTVQVVQPETLTGCTSPGATADTHSLSLAVTVSGAGSYRAADGIYAVDAEL